MIVVIVNQSIQHVLSGQAFPVLDSQEHDLKAGLLERVAEAIPTEERYVFDVAISEPSSAHCSRDEAVGCGRRDHQHTPWSQNTQQLIAQLSGMGVVLDRLKDGDRIERRAWGCIFVQATDGDVQPQTTLYVVSGHGREVDAGNVKATLACGSEEEAGPAANVQQSAGALIALQVI